MVKAKNSHNPYFNRWFSAIKKAIATEHEELSHNPYFNRWFSAMRERDILSNRCRWSQSLF